MDIHPCRWSSSMSRLGSTSSMRWPFVPCVLGSSHPLIWSLLSARVSHTLLFWRILSPTQWLLQLLAQCLKFSCPINFLFLLIQKCVFPSFFSLTYFDIILIIIHCFDSRVLSTLSICHSEWVRFKVIWSSTAMTLGCTCMTSTSRPHPVDQKELCTSGQDSAPAKPKWLSSWTLPSRGQNTHARWAEILSTVQWIYHHDHPWKILNLSGHCINRWIVGTSMWTRQWLLLLALAQALRSQ